MADYDLVDSRDHEWVMNWKLVMDTFTEPYHIPWLHKDSIAPYYLFDRWIHDAYGPHQHFIGCRRSVLASSTSRTRTTGTSFPTARCSTCSCRMRS